MKKFPNILIVIGTGRNVGKTLTACNIIKNLSETQETIGVKISPHFHELANPKIVCETDNFVIIEEKRITKKDSSRMLQAGAKRVFYVQAENNSLPAVFAEIMNRTARNHPIVIETGGLYNHVEPGLLFYILGENPKKEIKVRNESKVIRLSSAEINDFNWNSIQFKNCNFNVDVGI